MRDAARVGALVLLVAFAGCGGSDSPAAKPPSRGAIVHFRAQDGVRLAGRSFGSGPVAVVLSHMGRGGDSQVDWYPAARELAADGYWALTYNRRGVCWDAADGCSRGVDDLAQSWKDVVGAYRYARGHGADRVVLVGASVGAMSSLFAAAHMKLDIDGLVEVGGINNASGYAFTTRDLARIDGAKLFVSSAGDIYGGADAARQWHRWARPPKQLVILKGSEHGTDMLRAGSATRARLLSLIREFVRRRAAI